MNANEFAAAKRKAAKSEPIIDGLNPIYYSMQIFEDSITPKRKQIDCVRWIHDRYLSDKNLIEKIRAQIKYEAEEKIIGRPVMEWGKLLNTKLFNNPRI